MRCALRETGGFQYDAYVTHGVLSGSAVQKLLTTTEKFSYN